MARRILHYDATYDEAFLNYGREQTVKRMAHHLTHAGVHDHGFNNVSTYGNLWRLMLEGRIPANPWEQNFYELALKNSGAVQANRWSYIANGEGFIYSFNGPHSLFADTIRSLRSLAVCAPAGPCADGGERPEGTRCCSGSSSTPGPPRQYAVYYGEGRDAYDIRGRTAHESIFNVNDGNYRCPNSQQGYSPFTTWTRGLAWIMCGCAELLEFLDTCGELDLEALGGRQAVTALLRRPAEATCDFYIEHTPVDGIPYWDTGAPNLHRLGNYLDCAADPFNDWEPVDSSAAAIAAQGLLRLGAWLAKRQEAEAGRRYWQAGLTVLNTLFDDPYLSTDPNHQGLLLHSIYHRPNGWDHVPAGRQTPCGESSMWGDYHAREAALYLRRLIEAEALPRPFSDPTADR